MNLAWVKSAMNTGVGPGLAKSCSPGASAMPVLHFGCGIQNCRCDSNRLILVEKGSGTLCQVDDLVIIALSWRQQQIVGWIEQRLLRNFAAGDLNGGSNVGEDPRYRIWNPGAPPTLSPIAVLLMASIVTPQLVQPPPENLIVPDPPLVSVLVNVVPVIR
jgi:hypothetical protein